MGNMISFAEVLGAIFMSFAVALTLQWIGLVALMRLMPAKRLTCNGRRWKRPVGGERARSLG